MDCVAALDGMSPLLDLPAEPLRAEDINNVDAVQGPEVQVNDQWSATEDSLPLPLGSLLELKIDFICAYSPTEAVYLKELATGSTEGGPQLSLRGRLHLAGGSSQRAVTIASLRSEHSHCKNKMCIRLLADDEGPVTLRFELSPDVATNLQPQLSLELRSRGSQKRQMSLWIALPFLLRKLYAGVDYHCTFPLLDQDERTCGHLSASFRSGLQTDLLSGELQCSTVEHKPEACILSAKMTDLQALGNVTDGIRCFARVWSSTTAKSSAQNVPSLMWSNGGSAAENNEAKAVSLKVNDRNIEVLFIGLYRFSTHERNELIGCGSFTIPPQQPSIPEGSPTVEQSVCLYCGSAGKEYECGFATFALQTSRIDEGDEVNPCISLAATGLGGVAYPVQSGELKCRFDIVIVEVRSLPVTVAEGDTVSIQLRILQSNWKTELGPTIVVAGIDGGKELALVGDKTHATIRWSAKDRSFPVLEVLMFLQHKRQSNRIGLASSASLTPTSRLICRQDRQASKPRGETVAPVLMATGSLNLSSFFSQLNISVLTDLPVALEKAFVSTDPAKGDSSSESLSVFASVRASSCHEDGAKSPTTLGALNPVRQPVRGDVCIHLLQATGAVFRKASCLSSYYVVISCGSEEVNSSCCSVDDLCVLSWNQQLALPVASSGPPVVHLTLYHRTTESAKQDDSGASQSTRGDEIVGHLTLPIFPSVLVEDHLLQLGLPFGMPLETASTDSDTLRNDPYYYKRGMITLEMQFLSSQQPKISTGLSAEVLELVIHRMRGNLQGTTSALGLAKHVFMEISLLTDRGGKAEEVHIGSTNAITISASGMKEVAEVISLSNPVVANTFSNDPSSVIVGRIRDFSGNYYGRVHLPLRKGWRERLVRRKKQIWYPVCIEVDKETTATKNAVLMSLQVGEQENSPPTPKSSGKFYVSICEVIIDHSSSLESSNLLKLGKLGGAYVEVACTSTTDVNNRLRFRTMQSTVQNNSHHWRWENEWFVFTHKDEPDTSHELQISLHIGAKTNQSRLKGQLDLCATIENARLRRFNLWIALTDEPGSADATISAHLHVVVTYLPDITGTICMEFGESYTFAESERMLQVENTFYKCSIHDTSYSTSIKTDDTSDTTQRLRLPFDARLDSFAELPEFIIQRMGVTKLLGELCLGVLSMDLLSVVELCGLASGTLADTNRERFTWCEFKDKSDRAKITGVARLRVVFDPAGNTIKKHSGESSKTLEQRVASAEVFTIWKKLFYLLDQNGNGYIDRKEFTNVFVNHLEDMVETSDGKKLLQLLFNENNQASTLESKSAPTQPQIAALFSMMDTNRDNEIEWTEYLRFLQLRQQQLSAAEKDAEVNPASDCPQVESIQLEQKRELRKKHREDRRATPLSSEGRAVPSSNQDEIPPDRSREATASSGGVKQEPSASKRSSKVSSAEAKLLKLQYSNEEQSRLQKQITYLETIIALERRRYAELAADRQALMRSYQQLHLKHQKEMIQEQTKAKWMKQTIERQQQQLQERETLRQTRNSASIVLQSTVRSRLEQKRYQGLKLQRANAAIAIQCMVRCVKAKSVLQVLQELDRVTKQRIRAVSRLQKFIRYHLYRKERALLLEARNLSATIVQKNARRLTASSTWQRQKIAVLNLQCWVRRRLSIRHVTNIRRGAMIVKTAVLGWFARLRYAKMKNSCRKLQRWWRRASKERSAFLELSEAVLCVQSAWKRRSTKKWFEREWERQEKYLSELEATICIQAAWRGRHQRLKSFQSRESTPRPDDDSVAEALLYSMIATIEADAVAPLISTNPVTVETSSMDGLADQRVDTFTNSPSQQEVFLDDNNTTVNEEDEVLPVLNNLVDAVVGAIEKYNLFGSNQDFKDVRRIGSSSHSNFAQDETNSRDGTVDPENTLVDISDPSTDEVESVELDVNCALVDNTAGVSTRPSTQERGAPAEVDTSLDEMDLAMIQSLLEYIKDFVESTAVAVNEAREGTSVSSRQYVEPDSLRDNSIEVLADTSLLKQGSNATENHETIGTYDETQRALEEQKLTPSARNEEPEINAVTLPVAVDDSDGADRHGVATPVDAANLSQSSNESTTPTQQPDTDECDQDTTLQVLSKTPEVPEGAVVDAQHASSARLDNNATSNNESQDERVEAMNEPQQEDDEFTPTSDQMSTSAEADSDVETAVGDFTMPDDPDSSPRGDSDDGSSMDSDDLMMEADAMLILQDPADSDHATAAEQQPSHPRKAERMDSSVLLADSDQLEAQDNLPIPEAVVDEDVDK